MHSYIHTHTHNLSHTYTDVHIHTHTYSNIHTHACIHILRSGGMNKDETKQFTAEKSRYGGRICNGNSYIMNGNRGRNGLPEWANAA